MKTSNIIEGMVTLLPYYDHQNGYHTECIYKNLRMFPTDRPLSEEDLNKMISLDWYQDIPGYNGYNFKPEHYRQDEAWISYG